MFAVPALLYVCALSLYPLGVLVKMSFSNVTASDLLKPWPGAGFSNYTSLFQSQEFHSAALNTVIYVAVVVGVGLGGGLLIALAFTRDSRFVAVTLGLMVFVWSLPPIINGDIWRFLLSSDGLINVLLRSVGFGAGVEWLISTHLVLLSVALVNGWAAVPFAALVFRSALLDVSPELIEATRVDGATGRQAVRHVVLPLLRPTAAVLAILMLVNAFRSFDYIYVMTSGGPGTLSTTLPYLTYEVGFGEFQYSLAAAIAVVVGVVVFVLAVFYGRSVSRQEVQA